MAVREDLNRHGIGMTSQRTRERLLERLFEEGIRNLHVLETMRRTPRHLFVDEALSHRAYEDTALPIGHNQTLSQPYIVARMTELLLGGGPLDKVLEIGTGSGYQTAVLAQVVERVFTVERIYPLQERAKEAMWCFAIQTVTGAGLSMAPTMRSWSLQRQPRCQSSCSISWRMADGW
jgi:protein-L-isoaspartate(D-aspartate) O-methyltransferase